MTIFWILWIFTATMSLIPIYFFFIGLNDGSITARNIGLWVIILLIIAGVLAGSFWLKDNDRLGMAKGLLMLAAIPGLFVVLYFIVVLTNKGKWN